jgi:epoxyqueuosine reductase
LVAHQDYVFAAIMERGDAQPLVIVVGVGVAAAIVLYCRKEFATEVAMPNTRNRISSLAREHGADLVGITTRTRLADGPPSADPTYLLPSAQSVVAFAVALDPGVMRGYLAKRHWLPHCNERKEVVQRVYSIGDALAAFLRNQGHDAVNVDVNNNYRPEEGAADVTEMTEFHPEFSHRYAALAAGIGRLGWSGNLMTPQYGALVELGSVITSARLEPDAILDVNPCDRCRACASVCPVGMISPTQSIQVTVAGITEEIAAKRPNTCCWIGCTGYEGLAQSGKWSNWSPYRLGQPIPRDDRELDELCIRLQKADPQMQAGDNAFDDYRKAVFDPQWLYYTVCGYCRGVCWAERADRMENARLIRRSGTAALSPDGMHVVAGPDAREHETPFGVRVVMDRSSASDPPSGQPPGMWPLDGAVLERFTREE